MVYVCFFAGQFYNNTVHSVGMYGLWMFERYTPTVTAVFKTLTVYNSVKGAECVYCGNVQFHDFVIVNMEQAGIEYKMIVPGIGPFTKDIGPVIKGACIAAYDHGKKLTVQNRARSVAIVLPYKDGLLLLSNAYINYDGFNNTNGVAVFMLTTITGTTGDFNGGYEIKSMQSKFVNSASNIFCARWTHEFHFTDVDGSLTGGANQTVVATAGHLPTPNCTLNTTIVAKDCKDVSICNNYVRFVRIAWNAFHPTSISGKMVNMTDISTGKSVLGHFEKKRITHVLGWMVLLVMGQTYRMSFDNTEHITNITYNAMFTAFQVSLFDIQLCIPLMCNFLQMINKHVLT